MICDCGENQAATLNDNKFNYDIYLLHPVARLTDFIDLYRLHLYYVK